ncbi:hypothetical protein DPMN_155499 [Dreissena polymorpha]|uniref:Uncharacterized protein n=1 Tax=Dreissena polymorpha TaxID=45954 RepID=A0A9D4FNY9_DREPO|nr:hypothetical protein DPMN_155499 [Dreissena polymorpha]
MYRIGRYLWPALFFDKSPQLIAFWFKGGALVSVFHHTKLGFPLPALLRAQQAQSAVTSCSKQVVSGVAMYLRG